MKAFRKGHEKINDIPLDAKKEMDRNIISQPQDTYSKLSIRNDEDCAFGSLAFFLSDDKKTKARKHLFLKL
jgi:hypothetical protein